MRALADLDAGLSHTAGASYRRQHTENPENPCITARCAERTAPEVTARRNG